MIARHPDTERQSLWAGLNAALATTTPGGTPDAVAWRQDGRPVQRDGVHYARFVAGVRADVVRARLDEIVPGEWDLTLELLPAPPGSDADLPGTVAFKARLQVLGVIREAVGTGRDYKAAATDAFKCAAARFGIASAWEGRSVWVPVEPSGDHRPAMPLEDPQAVYLQKHGAALAAPAAPTAPRGGRRTAA